MVTVIDVATRQAIAEIPVGVEPEGMGVSHDGKWLVNTSETTNMAHFIDTDTHEITDNVLVDQRPRFAEFTADDAEIWVSSEVGGTVSVIDNATRKVKHKITLRDPGRAEARRSSRSASGSPRTASKAFVALGPANRVAVIDAQTFEVENYLLVGQRVWQLAFSPDEKFLYSTNGVSNDISVIDVDKLEVMKSVTTVGATPGAWWSATENCYGGLAAMPSRPADLNSPCLCLAGLVPLDRYAPGVVITAPSMQPAVPRATATRSCCPGKGEWRHEHRSNLRGHAGPERSPCVGRGRDAGAGPARRTGRASSAWCPGLRPARCGPGRRSRRRRSRPSSCRSWRAG